MADETFVVDLLRRWETLKTTKSNWMPHWDDLARVLLPRRAGFITAISEGERRTEEIYDGTPMRAARGLASAFASFTRPIGSQWHQIKIAGSDGTDEEQQWLGEVDEHMNDAYNGAKARFLQSTGEVDQDVVALGTGILFVGETQALDSLLFKSVHLRDGVPFFNEDGEAEGMFWEVPMTLRQAVKRFGSRLSDNARRAAADAPDTKMTFVRAILPRPGGTKDAILAKNMPFGEFWIEPDPKSVVEEGGFHEFPFVVPRWDTSSGEDYGRSPGMIALPDADTLQAMGETLLVAGERAADPPIFAPNDGSFTDVYAFPGGLNHYDVESAAAVGGNPFFTLKNDFNMPLNREMQGDFREQVFAAFFRNVLNLPVEGPQMTATEVIQRKDEFIREIGPVFGRSQTDYTAPMHVRSFMTELRRGRLPQIPDSLAGRNITFEYEDPIKRIRQQIQASAARLWAREQLALEEFSPGAGDIVDVEGLGRFEHEALGLPEEVIKSPEAVAQLRQQRAEQQAKAEEIARLQQGADLAKTGADAAATAGLIPQQQ